MNVYSPIYGNVIQLTELNDGMFSEGFLGPGISICSNKDKQVVCSPIDGEIISIFPTNHAFIVGDNSKQVLVHIGIDTIELEGRCFERIAQIGQKVKIGDEIIKTDFSMIKKAGLVDNVIILSPENTITFFSDNKPVETGKDIVLEI